MTTTIRLVKLALRREDDGTPVGHPAPTYFRCPCGRKIPVYDRNGDRVTNGLTMTCECGERVHIDGYIHSGRRTVRVTFGNGDSITTGINGTKQEIIDYYIGKWFNIGHGEDDNMQWAERVDFID